MDTFYIGAAEGTTWPLTVDEVQAAVTARTPGASTTRSHAAVSDKDQLWFTFDLPGTNIECLYTDQFSITIGDCEPADAAAVLSWLLGLLPAATPTVALTETNPTPTTIDIRTGRTDLTEVLARLSAA